METSPVMVSLFAREARRGLNVWDDLLRARVIRS